MTIDKFAGDNFFLSNFFPTQIEFEGITYSSTEAAFQAQKTLDQTERKRFIDISPSQAKHLGRRVSLRSDWEDVKARIMHDVVLAKFTQHPDLADKLYLTGDDRLIEGNTWGDTYWGQVNGKGLNMLGEILMIVRQELREGLSRPPRLSHIS